MKKIFSLVIFIAITFTSYAQSMKEIITNMPDSITPLLTKNNRLDFIDYLAANQKAEEKNAFGAKSEMTKLTETRSTIRVTDSSTMDFKILKNPETMVGIITTVQSDKKIFTSIIKYYSLPDWKLLKTTVPKGFTRFEWNDDNEELNITTYTPLELKFE